MRRRANEGADSRESSDRGLWSPSLAQVVALGLLVTMGLIAASVSHAPTKSLGVKTEVTTELDESFVTDDGSVIVTVVEQQSGERVNGVTVRPTAESVRLDSSPERTSDEEGTVHFEFGHTAQAIDIDWGVGEQIATVTFEVEPPGEEYVDRRSNAELTVRRSDGNADESEGSPQRLEDSIGGQGGSQPVSGDVDVRQIRVE